MTKKSPHLALSSGFTLVELMVSMALGLLVLLALVTLLFNINRNNTEMSKTNGVIENGRYALQLLQSDISHAGYWGGYVPEFDNLVNATTPTDVPAAVPDPCLAYATPWSAAHKTALIGNSVQAYEIPATVPAPTLSVCADNVVSPQGSTDVLIVRHTENCVPGVGGCTATVAGELYFQVARCGTGAVLSPAYVLDSDATLLTLQNRDCTTTAETRKFVSNLYYVRNYAVTAGDGIPTLMRSQFGLSGGTLGHQTAQAMIEGIEGFRVEFGVDNVSDSGGAVDLGAPITWADSATKTSPTNRGDGVPDGAYVHCTTLVPCTVAQLTNTVAVKVYVLVRSDKTTPGYTDTKVYAMGSTSMGPFNDAYKRHLYSQTIRVTNVATRRETP